MTIQYVEVSVIKNVNQEPFFKNICREYLGYEYGATNDDTIVILFEDGTIYDTNEPLPDVRVTFKLSDDPFDFSPLSRHFPKVITLKSGIELTYEAPSYDSQKKYYKLKSLNYLFHKHPKYKLADISLCNFTYAISNESVFGTLKLKSNVNFQMYLVAFDDDILDKQQVIYLINHILKIKKYDALWLKLFS